MGILEIWNRLFQYWRSTVALTVAFSAILLMASMITATNDDPTRVDSEIRFTAPVFENENYAFDASQYARAAVGAYRDEISSPSFLELLRSSTAIELTPENIAESLIVTASEDGATLHLSTVWPDSDEALLIAQSATELIADDALNLSARFSDGRPIVTPEVKLVPEVVEVEDKTIGIMSIATALVGGIVLALLTSLMRALFSNRIRTTDDVKLALPPLSHLEITGVPKDGNSQDYALRELRSRLIAEKKGAIVLITSASSSGQSEFSRHLGETLATAEYTVALVDLLPDTTAVGFSSIEDLLDDHAATRQAEDTQVVHFVSGSKSVEDLVASRRMSLALEQLQHDRDFVLVACPASSESSVASTLLRHSASVVVLVDPSQETRRELTALGGLLDSRPETRVEVLVLGS